MIVREVRIEELKIGRNDLYEFKDIAEAGDGEYIVDGIVDTLDVLLLSCLYWPLNNSVPAVGRRDTSTLAPQSVRMAAIIHCFSSFTIIVIPFVSLL